MRLLILALAILLLFIAQDSYATGNAVGAGALLLFGVLVVFMCGYVYGFDLAEESKRPPTKPDEPTVGGGA
jgi:hypothetical protein